jgi:hypothetical protein
MELVDDRSANWKHWTNYALRLAGLRDGDHFDVPLEVTGTNRAEFAAALRSNLCMSSTCRTIRYSVLTMPDRVRVVRRGRWHRSY